MKHSGLFFLAISLYVPSVKGMSYKRTKKKAVEGVDQSYITAMNNAFESGNGGALLQLYKLDPRLFGYLRQLVADQQDRAAWALRVSDVVERIDQGNPGRIQHSSHPVVVQRLSCDRPRARL